MKLAFCISGPEKPFRLDDRFGRAWGFVVLEVSPASGESPEDYDKAEAVENSGRESAGAAGTGAVQDLVNRGVEGLVAPHLGPKAEEARKRLGLKLWSQGDCKDLNEALKAWREGSLEDLTDLAAPQGLYRA